MIEKSWLFHQPPSGVWSKPCLLHLPRPSLTVPKASSSGIGEPFHLGRLRRDPGPVPGASSQVTAEEPQAPAPQGILKPISAAPMIRLSGIQLS